jgi:coenzyme F420-0:L-glutamate ligase/coenzyme F420-1:gamma-L-glutamate ligase
MTESQSNQYPSFSAIGITGLPEIQDGDNLGQMIAEAARNQGTPLLEGDILIVTQKVVSKAEGMLVSLDTVTPSQFAREYAANADRDPRLIELVLRESRSIVRMDQDRGVLITETKHGFVCANAGIDQSNIPDEDVVCLLPVDPDASARRIREEIREVTGVAPPIIISDTFGRAWREGHVNFAIGVAGMNPLKDYRGTEDANGRIMHVTTIAVADELAATAEMITAKAINVPVALIRGMPYQPEVGSTAPLIRDRTRDMFR